jgi:two-component system NtrC family sensor kinase
VKSKKLSKNILISLFGIIAIFVLSMPVLGFYVIKKNIIESGQAKVKNDLNTARLIYQDEIEIIRDVIRFTALRFFIKDAISRDEIDALKKQLEEIRKTESLDVLNLTDENGKVLVRSRNPSIYGDDQSHDELLKQVIQRKKVIAGTVVVSSAELMKEGRELAQQSYMKLTPTPKAKPTSETELTDGMMIKAAAPVFGNDGRAVGILYGGTLLNRNFEIVDRVKQTVYQDAKYKGRDIGTATIFQGDIRISTNVRSEDGSRAIATRVSEAVYDQVLDKGLTWTDRAFVVTDWYKTAYEPIRDINGRIIGILYVGTLEKPFADMERNTFLVFLIIVLIATLLACVLSAIPAGAISRPVTNMLQATKKISEGNLGYKVNAQTGIDELNTLAASFNEMSTRLNEREQSLKIANKKLAELNKTYLDLVSFVSHELKGILASTTANAYSLQDRLLGTINDEQERAINSITRNLDYLAGTLSRFLNLSRIEKGELELHKAEVSLREDVFNRALEAFSSKAAEKQMEIVNNLQPQLKAKCDKDLLLVAANNLIGNAILYGFNKGKVILNSKEVGGKIQVEVYNDSRPVTPLEKERLFRKFSRLDTIETKQAKGTGLGLFITKEIITKHGGEIWIEPKEQGNSFIFQIEKGA